MNLNYVKLSLRWSHGLIVFNVLIFFTLQYCIGFAIHWHESAMGVHVFPHPETPSHFPPHPIPLGHLSAPAPSTLYHVSNLDWWLISHVIIYMFQCHSPISSCPRPLPQSPKDCSIHLCLSCGLMLKFDTKQNASLWLPWRCVIASVETLFIWRSPWPFLGFPDSSVVKESVCNAGDPSSIPGSGRFSGEGIGYSLQYSWASLEVQLVKNLPVMQETWVRSLGWEDPLEERKATHSSILAQRIPCTV